MIDHHNVVALTRTHLPCRRQPPNSTRTNRDCPSCRGHHPTSACINLVGRPSHLHRSRRSPITPALPRCSLDVAYVDRHRNYRHCTVRCLCQPPLHVDSNVGNVSVGVARSQQPTPTTDIVYIDGGRHCYSSRPLL
ncbi:hypothetical protein ACLOJK_018896 [Asimina triloba]